MALYRPFNNLLANLSDSRTATVLTYRNNREREREREREVF